MATRKLGWTRKVAEDKSKRLTATWGCVKLIDGSYAALSRIRFEDNYTRACSVFLMRDDSEMFGQWLADNGKIDPQWLSTARDRVKTVA